MSGLTAERPRELLHFDTCTGVFRWRRASNSRVLPWAVAGHVNPVLGYVQIGIDGKHYLAHRLAWYYVHGVWPADQLDHRDGVRSNNRMSNLREAGHAENGQNQTLRSDNTSGFLGVSWFKRDSNWKAQIRLNGTSYSLGYFDTPEEAHAAYLAAKKNLHLFNPVPRKTTTGTSSNDPIFTHPRSARNR